MGTRTGQLPLEQFYHLDHDLRNGRADERFIGPICFDDKSAEARRGLDLHFALAEFEKPQAIIIRARMCDLELLANHARYRISNFGDDLVDVPIHG